MRVTIPSIKERLSVIVESGIEEVKEKVETPPPNKTLSATTIPTIQEPTVRIHSSNPSTFEGGCSLKINASFTSSNDEEGDTFLLS